MDDTKAKPCPLCGGKMKVGPNTFGHDDRDADCILVWFAWPSEPRFLAAWNDRPTPDGLDEQVESILSLHRYDTEDDRKRADEAIRIYALRATPAPDGLRKAVQDVVAHIERYEGQETFTIAKWQLDALEAALRRESRND